MNREKLAELEERLSELVEELDDLKDDFSDTFDWDEDVDEDPDNDDGEDILENKDNIFACIDRAYNDLNEALDDLTDLV